VLDATSGSKAAVATNLSYRLADLTMVAGRDRDSGRLLRRRPGSASPCCSRDQVNPLSLVIATAAILAPGAERLATTPVLRLVEKLST